MTQPRLLLCWVVLLVSMLWVTEVSSEPRRVVSYDYDAAGNTVRVEQSISLGPPAITSLTPPVMRIGSTTQVIASGVNMKLAVVSTSAPSISIANVATFPEQVVFDITPHTGAAIGSTAFTFTTRQGSATLSIDIQPRLPQIQFFPPRLEVPVDGTLPVVLSLSSTDIFDHPVTITVADPTIATVSPNHALIAAGNINASVRSVVTALAPGQTHVTFSSPQLASVRVSVFVAEPPDLVDQALTIRAAPVGLTKVTPLVIPLLATRAPSARHRWGSPKHLNHRRRSLGGAGDPVIGCARRGGAVDEDKQ